MPSHLDPAMLIFLVNEKLQGLVCCHVDDFLHAGSELFDCMIMHKLTKRFVAGKLDTCNFKYIGFDVNQDESAITVDQTEYPKELEIGAIHPHRTTQKHIVPKEQTRLRQLVGRLNWMVQGSRPDMAFETIDLSIKLKNGVVEDLLRAMKVVRGMKQMEAKIYFPPLSPEIGTIGILCFTQMQHMPIFVKQQEVSERTLYFLWMVGGGGHVVHSHGRQTRSSVWCYLR